MENTCNFCALQDQSVREIQNNFTQDLPMLDIVAKHFWFTKDELISFNICDSCAKQLLEFHQFYSQVEKLYFAQVDDIKVEYVPLETDTNHIEQESVDLKIEAEISNEASIGIETVDDVEMECGPSESNTDHIEPESVDPETNAEDTNEEFVGIETKGKKTKKARRLEKEEPLVTDDEIRIFCRMQCHICSEEFDYYRYLQAHCQREHNQRCYVNCCDCRFEQLGRLQEHILVHIDPTRFQCKQCKKNLNTKRSLLRHQDTVHRSEDTMKYKCTMCPKKYAKLYLLNKHMACHLDPTPSDTKPKCPICEKLFKNESWLEVHVTQKHGITT